MCKYVVGIGTKRFSSYLQTIIKNKLVLPILNTMFQLMCSPCDEDDDTSFFGNDESNAPPTVAAQTLDVLALHLPPNKILPALVCILNIILLYT